MTSGGTKDNHEEIRNRSRYQIRLPGFVAEEGIGLGDVTKRIVSAVGIKPCRGCERRAAILNSWVTFRGWH